MKQEEANLGSKEIQVQYLDSINNENSKAKNRISSLKAQIIELEPQAFANRSPTSKKLDPKAFSPSMVYIQNYPFRSKHLLLWLSMLKVQLQTLC